MQADRVVVQHLGFPQTWIDPFDGEPVKRGRAVSHVAVALEISQYRLRIKRYAIMESHPFFKVKVQTVLSALDSHRSASFGIRFPVLEIATNGSHVMRITVE